MFTGIISHIGIFKEYRMGKQAMVIESPELVSRLELGESLAVNGVCLSLTGKEKNRLYFDLSKETLGRTNLGSLRRGDKLNLELSLTLSSPLSGHLVTGHIDGIGKIKVTKKVGIGTRITISFPEDLSPYLIPKGSVAIDGVSLTIAELKPSSFDAEIIPITQKNSNLGFLKPGNTVNIECDIIGKYVYNWLSKTKGKS
jgi:riboflavin synthase